MADNERNVGQFREDDEITIDLYELFSLFLQKLKFIIIAALIGAIAVGAYTTLFVAPEYKATAKLYVVSASNDSVVNLSDLQIGTNLTADYKELVLSRPMLESTIRNLNLDKTTGQLLGMLSVSNTSGTRILNITATSTDPQEAKDIANEMAHLAVSWLPEVMESNEPNIVEEAVLPTQRSGPNYVRNAAIGAFALAVICFGFFVVQMLMNDTIVTAEDMEHYFGIVPLTAIPEEEGIDDGETGEPGKPNRKRNLIQRIMERLARK